MPTRAVDPYKKKWTLDRADKRYNEKKIAIKREMWGRRKMNRGLWRGILQETDDLEGVDIAGRIIFRWVL